MSVAAAASRPLPRLAAWVAAPRCLRDCPCARDHENVRRMFPVAAPDNLDESAAGFSACGDIFFADVGEGGSGGGGCSLDVSSLGTFGARLNDRLRRIELPRDLIEVGAAGGTVSAEGSASDMRCEDSADACGGCRAFVRLKDSTLLMPFMVPAMARGAGCAEFHKRRRL